MAVTGAITSKYRNADQICVCTIRILAQDDVSMPSPYDWPRLPGDEGFEPGAVIGPLIDMKAVEKVEAQIANAVNKAPRSSPAASAAHSAPPSLSRRSRSR
jgi:succinate-semialdehyde dehydrogenase/glutarate-semialdehyde dehydrogenase